MTIPFMKIADDLERLFPVIHRLTDPDQDPGRERYRELAGVLDHIDTDGRVFPGRVPVRGYFRCRLKHQPHARVHLPEPVEFLVGEDASVGVRQKTESYGIEREVVEVIEYIGIPDPLKQGGEPGNQTRALPECEERLGAPEVCAHLQGAEHLIGRHDAPLPHGGPETAVTAVVCADCCQGEECVP